MLAEHCLAAIVAIALINSPDFWSWAASVREVAFAGVKIRRE